MTLEKGLDKLEAMIEFAHLKKTSISQRGIDWHLDHSLNVLIQVYDALKESKPEDYKWTLNLVRLYIFAKGSIPRGKARAPRRVNNKEAINLAQLLPKLKDARLKISKLNDLPAESHFDHPYFGCIKRDKTIRFLELHTQHHWKIMDDIKNAK